MRMIIQPGARSARRVLTIIALGAILGAFLVWSAGSALASTQHTQTVQTQTKVMKPKPKPKPKPKTGGASAAALAAGKAEKCPAGKTIEQSPTNDQDADNFGGADDFDGCL
jgi:hypothetical protein